MKVTLVQSSLVWEDVSSNLKHLQGHIDDISQGCDLIVLPEMFSTGFTMQPERLAEEPGGPAFSWMQKVSQQKKAIVCGSVSVKENNTYYNRLYWVRPDGSFSFYNKRHLFRMAGEEQRYSAGTNKLIETTKEFRVCPLICYDLRFPVWSRNRFTSDASGERDWQYDVLIYVANWPEIRNYPWKQLLIARAIENQCYVLGVNRVGKDGNGLNHSGDSAIISPKGELLGTLPVGEEGLITETLDLSALRLFRSQFPAGMDADAFTID